MSLTNTILISPRRWGKSSLVHKAGKEAMAKDSNLKIVFIDIFNVRTENEFYSKFASEVLKQTASSLDNIMTAVKNTHLQLFPDSVSEMPLLLHPFSFR